MTELAALAGSEGYAVCDEAQRRLGTHEVQNALRGRGGAA